jgi:hypothetical protein
MCPREKLTKLAVAGRECLVEDGGVELGLQSSPSLLLRPAVEQIGVWKRGRKW